MKQMEGGDFRAAWGGISGISLALPVMWTEARHRGFTLTDVARWMAEAPARLAGCQERKGRLARSFDADFVVFDPDAQWIVGEAQLFYRHPVSPYLGERLNGKVLMTYLRGHCEFKEGAFPGQHCGGEYTGKPFAPDHN
jgi:allantoinase